ncbi:NADH-quinone oxidoreductase subunit NuoE [Methylocella sp.]|uniref:NADH-quinone oxidoreductase subunit NuoE n=1 Tax=Methylocella sp. TaxID=1978226 RepID=UPI003783FC91
MSVRRLAEVQPESFAFTPENETWAEGIIAKYPEGRQASAVISLLWRAQAQHDYWLPRAAIEEVARKLGMPYIRVLEVATFYTMFNLAPVGEHFVQLCGTTPCLLRGSDAIKAVLRERVGESGKVTADGKFSWIEVECLGACCNAPMVQINDDYYEDLTPENFGRLLDDLAAGRPVTIGSQTGRVSSEPTGGLSALTSLYGVDGVSGPQSQATTEAAAQAVEHETPPAPQADGAAFFGEAEKLAQEHAEHVAMPETPAEETQARTDIDPPEKPAAEPPSDAKA